MQQSDQFRELVSLKYQLFNSLFLTLPFSKLGQYGAQLPLFAKECETRLEKEEGPDSIVERFLERVEPEDRHDLLFLFLQLIERQVLLFDAIESAAYPALVGDTTDALVKELKQTLEPERVVRIVLTAHPTQFYPEVLLGVIQDLAAAVDDNGMDRIRKLLLQLGRTSFRNPHPPTPLEEAEMLIDQFGTVLVESFIDIVLELKESAPRLELGFWPGGDRDGNPNVTAEITQKVCKSLRDFARKTLLEHLDRLRRRITFKGVTEPLAQIRVCLQQDLYDSADDLKQALSELLAQVDSEHDGLFREEIERVLVCVDLFGFHFASLDLRESSDVIGSVFEQLHSPYKTYSEEERIAYLKESTVPTPVSCDLIDVLKLVPEIQQQNGQKGIHRFVVSHTEKVSHLMEIFTLSKWYAEGRLDIVPLFESIEDMQKAPQMMEQLLKDPVYLKHLEERNGRQTVMLGFSDGTKDGGYVTCNTEIQKCKEALFQLARRNGIELIFFDGRGGPPARGGGATHSYYAAVAEQIPLEEIQLTVQGQSISSYYGNMASAKHNLVQLLAALTTSQVPRDDTLIDEIGIRAHKHYQALRQHADFIPLLEQTTPLNLLGDLNIASRPPKRSKAMGVSLDNLRAISFVGAWSLMKVNVPAFYGFGLALEELVNEGKLSVLQELYKTNTFFQVLVKNAAQALRKSYLPLTQYTENDPQFGALWQLLRGEAMRASRLLLAVTKQGALELGDRISESSVALREQIILPLLVIQHFALLEWRKDPESVLWRKLLLKSIAPSINASRNSA